LVLLLATAAAFALTEHLKLIKSPIYRTDVTTVFSPVCKCATDQAKIGFSLRSAATITVTIVDSSGHEVDTLATNQSEPRGAVTFHWNGHTDTGALAPDGSSYQPQVAFSDRTITMPNTIAVDTTPPTVVSASDGNGLLIAGAPQGVAIQYVFNGRARAHVYFGARTVVLGRHKLPRGGVRWNGKVGGKALPPGRYVLEVAAVDKAGNETPQAEQKRVVVHIRAIALDASSIHVAAGARFTVKVRTTAASYAWTLAGKNGSGTTKLLHLRAPSRPGRYRLVVSEHHYSATATVIVGKR